jgi:pimeloyl-ACP methyl ester carboxylesterase
VEKGISYNGYHLEYTVFGSGSRPLLAFHGYDRDMHDFEVLEPSLGERYRIYSFNLFYHGQSSTPGPKAEIDYDILKGIFDSFMRQENVETFSLIGHSLGTKIVMALIEIYAEKIKKVFLLAPEGITVNRLYRVVSETGPGLAFFKQMVQKPAPVLTLARMLRKSRILNEKLYKFVTTNMETFEKREKVLNIWRVYRKISPNIDKLQSIVNKRHIHFHLFYGMFDRIIRPPAGKGFLEGWSDTAQLHIVEMGHNLVNPRFNSILQEIFDDLE